MKSRAWKYLAAIGFIFVLFLTVMAGYYTMTDSHEHFGIPAAVGSRDAAAGSHTDAVSQKLDGVNSLRASVPDGVLVSESGVISYIRSGRAEAGTAEYFAMLIGMFLFSSVYLFLPDGRSWSVIQSVCMDFQEYAMRQIHILQMRDGKKRLFSY